MCHGWLVQPCGTASKLAVAHLKSATLQSVANSGDALCVAVNRPDESNCWEFGGAT